MRPTEYSFSVDIGFNSRPGAWLVLMTIFLFTPRTFTSISGTSLTRLQPLLCLPLKFIIQITSYLSELQNVLMQLKVSLNEERRSKQHFLLQHQLPEVITIITTPTDVLVVH